MNAFEIGTKNVLYGGRLTMNLTGFYYDYHGYQIASLIDQSAVNQNVNAQIMGVEYESVWIPADQPDPERQRRLPAHPNHRRRRRSTRMN